MRIWRNRKLSGNRNVYKQQADAVGQIANRLDNKGINRFQFTFYNTVVCDLLGTYSSAKFEYIKIYNKYESI